MDKLLNSLELSQLLGVPVSTLKIWRHRGTIPYVKIGSLVRYKEHDIRAWIETGERQIRTKSPSTGTPSG